MIRFKIRTRALIFALACLLLSLFLFSCGGGRVSESPVIEDKTGGTAQTDEGVSDIEREEEEMKMYVYINGNKLEAELENNSSAAALYELLKKGDIVYTADDYGNFEKVGGIGHTLPQNNERIDTVSGDVILYQGTSVCLYYGKNSWNFTRLGRINGYTDSELRSLLGAGKGETEVKLSLK